MRKRNLNRHAVYTNHVTQQKKETKSVQFLITKIVWSAGHRPPRTSFPDPDQRTTKQTHGRQQVQGRPETRVSAPRPSPPLSPATRSASFRTPFPHRHRHTHSHSRPGPESVHSSPRGGCPSAFLHLSQFEPSAPRNYCSSGSRHSASCPSSGDCTPQSAPSKPHSTEPRWPSQ